MAMWLENVESVSRWLGAISSGSKDFDRALALVHLDVVFVPPGDEASYRGAESLRRWMERDTFQDLVIKAFAPVVVTERTILGSQLVTAGGTELEAIVWSVWTFDEDGLITGIALYPDHEQDKAFEAARLALKLKDQEDKALEAAGLSE